MTDSISAFSSPPDHTFETYLQRPLLRLRIKADDDFFFPSVQDVDTFLRHTKSDLLTLGN
ncbi:hypothetical protein M769_0119215 [Bacillus haynesii]|nr:hypothetical protein M769_0119215 [Bacillus haynesii]